MGGGMEGLVSGDFKSCTDITNKQVLTNMFDMERVIDATELT